MKDEDSLEQGIILSDLELPLIFLILGIILIALIGAIVLYKCSLGNCSMSYTLE